MKITEKCHYIISMQSYFLFNRTVNYSPVFMVFYSLCKLELNEMEHPVCMNMNQKDGNTGVCHTNMHVISSI